ncbi:DUF1206 domain-containing protein [Mycolicibacterium flavescens]|uniref:DUF1206 domain-containing protein n=1 Tax=Mycolicibacterium flavescens TaxID=1776 RepID=A0A1E3RBB4_MYCFV|nr:DUF1206 domain-containing protein [Mycolicibacterium flavescens]MCV7278348.1 DUF1206 domain-containing protein [Mycolicibacterium flavescens]ODQ87183.1 hypothetical protein BHQ18_24820 [Mycolicibacterium flavescens]
MSFKGAVNQATGSRVVQAVARLGYPVNGVLHLLIAYLIVRIAVGVGGDEADQTGALATIAAQRGGNISLWIVALGLFALTAWRLAETLLGLHPGECSDAHVRDSPIINRLKAFGLAVVYCALALTAIQFALGAHRRGSEQAAGLSARLMQSGGGKAVLVAIGLVIMAIGGYFAYKGASMKFLDDLTVPGGRLIVVLGVSGHVAEGAVLAAAGLSVIAASFLSEPARATGLDAAVKALGSAEYGKTLLVVAAMGFAAYGLYSFALTRYARM